MCHPAVGYAIAALSTAASIVGQNQAAKAQESYQEDLIKTNNVNATKSSETLREQQANQREAASREAEQARIAGRKAAATASTAAGESGVAGASVEALLGEFKAEEGRYKEALARQTTINDSNTESQIDALKTGASFQNIQTAQPIARPNYFAEGLKLGGRWLDIYNIQKAKKPPLV
ncbi:hypothetical protein OH491_25985 [Termitidicoccus mucosus]